MLDATHTHQRRWMIFLFAYTRTLRTHTSSSSCCLAAAASRRLRMNAVIRVKVSGRRSALRKYGERFRRPPSFAHRVFGRRARYDAATVRPGLTQRGMSAPSARSRCRAGPVGAAQRARRRESGTGRRSTTRTLGSRRRDAHTTRNLHTHPEGRGAATAASGLEEQKQKNIPAPHQSHTLTIHH